MLILFRLNYRCVLCICVKNGLVKYFETFMCRKVFNVSAGTKARWAAISMSIVEDKATKTSANDYFRPPFSSPFSTGVHRDQLVTKKRASKIDTLKLIRARRIALRISHEDATNSRNFLRCGSLASSNAQRSIRPIAYLLTHERELSGRSTRHRQPKETRGHM